MTFLTVLKRLSQYKIVTKLDSSLPRKDWNRVVSFRVRLGSWLFLERGQNTQNFSTSRTKCDPKAGRKSPSPLPLSLTTFLYLGRCIKDSTVQVHPHPVGTYRFSFETFQFVNGLAEPYVFIHCSVVLCDSADSNSRCTHGNKQCDTNEVVLRERLRRDITEESYALEQGPIVFIREGLDTDAERDARAQGV